MECLLCNLWARMPYAKRPTTPTNAQETEGALVVGYWIASRLESVPHMCEHHMSILQILDHQEERRIEAEKASQEAAQKLAEYNQQTAHLHERQQVIREATKAETSGILGGSIPSFIPAITTAIQPPAVNPDTEFKLGPYPLGNENIVTQHPPLPVPNDLTQPYQPKAKVGTAEAALEMAALTPVEGGKVSYPCPSCGKEVTTGEIHAC